MVSTNVEKPLKPINFKGFRELRTVCHFFDFGLTSFISLTR